MSRPRKIRQVQFPPRYTSFKPCGIPRIQLSQIELTLDEFEAIRLVDEQGLEQETAATQLGVSRPTVTRLVESARKKVASMLVKGAVLVIQGGNYRLDGHLYHCPRCRKFQEHQSAIRMPERDCPHCHAAELVEIAPEG